MSAGSLRRVVERYRQTVGRLTRVVRRPAARPFARFWSNGRWRRVAGLAAASLLSALVWVLLLDRLFPPPIERLERPASRVVYARDGTILRMFLAPDEQWRLPVSYDELSAELVEAFVLSEDRWFFQHPGVNPLAILRAAWQNVRHDRRVSGASTLPMQLARRIEPAPRVFGAKVREALRALQLERRLSKRELLVAYLNLAPFGGNLEGVGAASYFYFGKEPADLATAEIALLAALPRSPSRYDPVESPQTAREARDRVLEQLATRKSVRMGKSVLKTGDLLAARSEPLPARRRQAPFLAPHFARDVAGPSSGTILSVASSQRSASRILTTIDPGLQRSTRRHVEGALSSLEPLGIENAAAIVVETATGEVRALVGSADFFDASSSGQVNGALARRSYGSTLKPFLYGLAIDAGVATPRSAVLDLPRDYAGYRPENYDGRYRGRVSLSEALSSSLNAPAVAVLADLGVGSFLETLRAGGLESLSENAEDYGLPLVLGGGEATLFELTGLYAALARGGIYQPLEWTRSAAADGSTLPQEGGVRLLSGAAAHLVAEMLTTLERPDLPGSSHLTRDGAEVAWKTGTSFGHRDAWALGFDATHTVGVWVGRFDSREILGLSGAEHATPLLLQVLRGARSSVGATHVATTKSHGVQDLPTLELCALSRLLAHRDCGDRILSRYVPGVTNLDRCPVHRRVRNADGSATVVTAELPELVAFWQREGSSVASGARGSGARSDEEGARPATAVSGPRIVSPNARTPYFVRADAPLDHQSIALEAESSARGPLYWYRDGELLGMSEASRALYLEPRPGRQRIVVSDAQGRTDAVTLEVLRPGESR